MEQRQSQSKPINLASSFRRLFSRSTSRSNNDSYKNETTKNKGSPQKSATMRRCKSNKEVTVKRTSFDDFSINKSLTLPSPIRPPPPSPPSPSQRTAARKGHKRPPLISPTRRQHTHLPVTIMKSPSSAPLVHHSLPRQLGPPILRQTASSWDISPTGNFPPHSRCNATEKQNSLKPFACPSPHFGGSLIGPTAVSSSVMDINHTYSEPYHWLAPSNGTGNTTVSPVNGVIPNSRSVLELPPPPLPPRRNQVQTDTAETDKYYTTMNTPSTTVTNGSNSHDYMSISSLTLNPKQDPSDYQQPIVTQTTPLPSCLKHRQQTIRAEPNEIQKESSPEETKEEEEERVRGTLTRKICRADTRRTTVVILHDDRTLKV